MKSNLRTRLAVYLGITIVATVTTASLRIFGLIQLPGSMITVMRLIMVSLAAASALLIVAAWPYLSVRRRPNVPVMVLAAIVALSALGALLSRRAIAYRVVARDRQVPELLLAAGTGDAEAVGSMLEAGHDPNGRGSSLIWLPLQAASYAGHELIVRQLLAAGADPKLKDRNGTDAAWAAVTGGHLSILQLLREAGVALNSEHLRAAAQSCRNDIMEYLIDHGLDPNDFSDGLSAFSLAASTCDASTTRLLAKRGVRVDAYSPDCSSALTWAAYDGKIDAMRTLVELGANVNGVEPCVGAPLSSAASAAQNEAMRFLLGMGAQVDVGQTGESIPLIGAVASGIPEVVDLLLQAGASINRAGTDGRTGLHCAVEERLRNMVEHLLAKGADPALRDRDGKTPLELAHNAGWSAGIAVLERVAGQAQ